MGPNIPNAWAEVAFYAGLGFIIPACAVAGYFAGAYLDRHLHTGLVLTAVGILAGAGLGIADVIRIVMRREKSAGDR